MPNLCNNHLYTPLNQSLFFIMSEQQPQQAEGAPNAIPAAKAATAEKTKSNQQIPGYQVLGRLGAGAMATVYKGRQISLDRLVAIKVLPKKFCSDQNFIKRFYDEGKAAAKLNHPNIVQAYDVGYSGEYHYFVMEYVDGWTVHDDITKHGAYSEKRALEIAIDVAEALKHAHDKGFIHRDVKPKNIMITQNGRVKLADMGLARAVSDREAAEAEKGKAFGTPYYISPEQVRGELDIDGRADLYALGATLFHMVVGRVPFEGPNPSAVMYRHLRDELDAPDQLNKNLSTGISEVIEVMMAKDPNKRYRHAAELLQDLRNVLAGDAPVVAAHNFSLSSLTALESTAQLQPIHAGNENGNNGNASTEGMVPVQKLETMKLAAMAGWGAAGLFGLLFLLAIMDIF